MNKGFTLIELLVVVLIIGILAAIALPQYTKAVERSRLAEAVQVLGDAATAQSIYYMQHNGFADDIDTLNSDGDIQLNDAGDAWEDLAFDVATDGQVTMSLERANGMYDGGTIAIVVHSTGAIDKNCTADSSDGGFCTMAGNMGYAGS